MDKSELIKQLRIERDSPPPSATSRWPWWLAAVLVAAGAAWWLLARPQAVLVKTVVVAMTGGAGAQASILDATGYVVARRRATVSAKITGKVRDVRIEEGQRVAEGDVLAELDGVDLQAQLTLAQAQLEAARSQKADLQVQLAQAERDRKRQQELVGRRLTSAQAAEQARSAVQSLKARLAAQERQVEVAEEAVRVARVNLDNTVIRAPFAGVIVAKTAQPGEIVSPMSAGGGFTRTGIGTIVDMDSLEIEVDVNEAFIGRVSPRQPVQARLNAYPDWKIPAEVIAIIPTADRSKATVKVRIALLVKDPRIVPEMGVRVGFLETEPAAAPRSPELTVPQSALRNAGERWWVFVANAGKAERREVVPGPAKAADRAIQSGIRAGERVIVDPADGLADGMAISEAH
ncbi:MAG: efflux RND transporter periplasmic adaptor subunit [Methylococcaceae bacterium]|nr:efflux RND transporter periplasmic adaptor subunit [Methylococcaceae bacterium]